MSQILNNLLYYLVPPLDQRQPSFYCPIFYLISLSITFMAAYIHAHHQILFWGYKILFTFLTGFIIIRLNFGFYMYFPWQPQEQDEIYQLLSSYSNSIGGLVFCFFVFVLDFLFLSDKQDHNVVGANEYRKYVLDQKEESRNTNDEENGYSLEKPKYYPGTSMPYFIDVILAFRGTGYKKGIKKKDQRENWRKGGYFALIESKRLEILDPSMSKNLKKDELKKIFRTFFCCLLILGLTGSITSNKKIINFNLVSDEDQHKKQFSILQIALKDTILPKSIAPFIISFLSGYTLIYAMQAIYSIFVLISLISTNPSQIPITIGRWEPLYFDQPHLSTSIKDMWGKHWHSLIRRPIIILFMRPCIRFAKHNKIPIKLGYSVGVLLSFLFSGLVHEACLETMLPHLKDLNKFQNFNEIQLRSFGFGWGAHQYATTKFFVLNGILIIIEEFWNTKGEPKLAQLLFGSKLLIQSNKIRFTIGWFWCMGWMTYLGIGLIDVWYKHNILVKP